MLSAAMLPKRISAFSGSKQNRSKLITMLSFKGEVFINAEPEYVKAVYLDYSNWHNTFSQTIVGADCLSDRYGNLQIEVTHKTEGKVPNELIMTAPNVITLKEWKPRYYAVFVNRFMAGNAGTVYQIEARLYLRGIYKVLQPFIKGFAKSRLRKYVLMPLKNACEKSIEEDQQAANS